MTAAELVPVAAALKSMKRSNSGVTWIRQRHITAFLTDLAVAPRRDELTVRYSNWVFRGYSPGRHIHGSSLRSRLRTVFSTRAARLGTLHELTKLGPVPPIIADALGYHPSTIERHAIGSASTYAEYIAAARELRQTS